MKAGKAIPAVPHRPGKSGERGYLLLVLFLFAALISIGLMRTIPAAFVESQREREEELIFRGQQYQRAIQAFVRKFGRYPNSVEELEQTNRIRFLRRRYRDPMKKRDPKETQNPAETGNPTENQGEWRLIHVGPGGTFPDAKTTISLPTQGAAAVNPSAPGGLGLPLSPEMQRPGGAAMPTGGFGGAVAPTGSPFQGSNPTPAPGSAPVPSPFQQTPQSGGFGAPTQLRQNPFLPPGTSPGTGAPGATPPGLLPSANPAANPAQQPRAAAAAAQQPAPLVFGGGGIAGVASHNTGQAIKVWNGHSQYDEWEFIYDFRTDPIGTAAIARMSGVVAQPTPQPAAPGQTPTPTPQPATQPGFPPTPFPSPFPGAPGSQPPGIRPGTPQFPPSPIPGFPPIPRQR